MKKLKLFFLIISINLLPKFAFSQLVHLELGGAGRIYSVNIDSRFSAKTNLGFRLGLGILPVEGYFLVAPLQINYVSAREYGFEIGTGFTLANSLTQLFNGQQFSGHDDSAIYPTITLAYRFQTIKPLNFRVGITSFLTSGLDFPLNVFYPTLSIGYQF